MIAVRFALVYLITAILDYAAFWLTLRVTGSILISQIAGRAVSVPFNYFAVRSKVFESGIRHEVAGPKFVILYLTSFFLSWGLIEWGKDLMPFRNPELRVITAKMIAEAGLLVAKFFIQRYLIFPQSR